MVQHMVGGRFDLVIPEDAVGGVVVIPEGDVSPQSEGIPFKARETAAQITKREARVSMRVKALANMDNKVAISAGMTVGEIAQLKNLFFGG